MNPRYEYLNEQADTLLSDLLDLYRWFHAHPELSGREEKTAERFARELERSGFSVTRKIGGHGVAGILRNGAGPVILVRADMDALPIKEETGLLYASIATEGDRDSGNVSIMHACGHDLHMTIVLGVARLFAGIADVWTGTLLIIGQPAEEGGLGAEKMVQDGLYERFGRPDAAFALHVGPNLPYGTVGCHPGEFSAGSDTLDLLISGQGGHAAYPEETIDPVVIAAQTILSLQTVVSRECDPHHFAVLTVARIHGGTKNNAIPDEVRLQINIRYYAPEVRELLIASIRRISHGIAAAAGVPEDKLPRISLHPDSVPPLENDPVLTDRCMNTWQEVLGSAHVLDLRPLSGSEDFSFFGRGIPPVPLCYFKIGCDDPEAITRAISSGKRLPSLHNSRFAPAPEPTIRTGIIAMGAIVLDYLKKK